MSRIFTVLRPDALVRVVGPQLQASEGPLDQPIVHPNVPTEDRRCLLRRLDGAQKGRAHDGTPRGELTRRHRGTHRSPHLVTPQGGQPKSGGGIGSVAGHQTCDVGLALAVTEQEDAT